MSVESLAEEFLDRLRRGEHPQIDEYAERYPALAREVREFFPALRLVENFKPGSHDEPVAAKRADGGGSVSELLDRVPERLGDFRILREISRGGMGIVYEAVQESLGRPVALKVLPSHALPDALQKKRFVREARAAARLHHTNIVPVFGVGEADGVHYYAMQFIPGLGLNHVLEEVRRLRSAVPQPASWIRPGDCEAAADPARPGAGLESINSGNNVSAAYVAHSLVSGRFALEHLPDAYDPTSNNDDSDERCRKPTQKPDSASLRSLVDLEKSFRSHLSSEDEAAAQRLSDTAAYVMRGRDASTSGRGAWSAYWQSVARIGAQVGEALQYAHDHGVLHRDIKPSNLLLDARGTAWVTDFGLAKADDQDDLTRTGDVLGTLRYMAPEVFHGNADRRSDVYSLGLTLYELLAMRPAFNDTNRHKLISQVMHHAPSPLRSVNRHIPRDIETIVHKAIDRDPSRRYQTAEALSEDLRRFIGDQPIRARRISYAAQLARWCRRNKTIASLTGAMLLLMMGAAVIATVAAASFRALAGRNKELADETAIALRESTQRLFESSLAEARSSRWSSRPGQRFNALAAIERAAQLIEPLGLGGEAKAALRDEAIAAMSLVDLKRVRTWEGAPHINWNVTFSRDLSRYAFVDKGNRVVRVRSTANPESDLAVVPYVDRYNRHYFCPDNRYLVVFSVGPAHVTVWNLETAEKVFSPELSGNWVFGDISPDGRFLALGEENETVSVYELATGKLIARHDVQKINDHIRRVEFSPDGKRLAVGRPNSGVIEILDVNTGEIVLRRTLTNSPQLWSIAWDPTGRWLAAGSWKEINLWDLRQPDRPPILVPGHESAVDHLNFHPSGALLVSYSWDGTSRIWEAATGFELLQSPEFFECFGPGGQMATKKGRELSLWDVALPDGVQWIYGNQPAYGVAVGLKGRLLALSFQDGVRLYDLAADREVGFIPLAMKNCGLLFHPVTGALITANGQGILTWPLRITDAESNDRHLHIGPPEAVDPAFDESQDVGISRDGSTIVAHSTRQSAVIVVKKTNESRQVFRLPRKSLRWIALSADGQWAAAGNWGGIDDVAVWDARIGEHVRNMTTQGSALAAFSPDSRWIVTNGDDAVRFWEVGTWRLRYTFPANVYVPSPVVFTRDSRIAAMARRGVGLHLIDLNDGEPLALLGTNQRRPHFESMCFTPDDGKLIAAQGDAGVCIWDLRTIHRQLKAMGLDWDQPPLPDEPITGTVTPLTVEVDMGALADAP